LPGLSLLCRRAGMAELAFPAMTACERLLHGDGAP
jgi:hypothetical protein